MKDVSDNNANDESKSTLESRNVIKHNDDVAITISNTDNVIEHPEEVTVTVDAVNNVNDNNSSQEEKFSNNDDLTGAKKAAKEIVDSLVEVLEEQKTNPSADNFCKGLFKTIYLCLGSREANLYNTSMGVLGVLNAVFSTEPDTFGAYRLKAYTGGTLLLFAALKAATILKEKYPDSAWNKIDKIARYSSSLSNGIFNAYSISCMVAQKLEGKGNLGPSASTYEGLGGSLGASLAAGILECYAQSKPADNLLRRASDVIIFALTLGSTCGQSQRLYNFFPGTEAPSDPLQNFFTYGPLAITAASLLSTICFRRTDMTFAARLGTFNNLAQDVGNLLQAYKTNDNWVYAFVAAKALFSIGGHYLGRAISAQTASAPLTESLLNTEQRQQEENNEASTYGAVGINTEEEPQQSVSPRIFSQ